VSHLYHTLHKKFTGADVSLF